MNKIVQVFGKERVFLPVIHFKNTVEISRSVHIAVNSGCDGLFFIKQGGISTPVLNELIRQAHEQYPKIWIGVNYLSSDNIRALKQVYSLPMVDGLWTDNACIPDSGNMINEYEYNETIRCAEAFDIERTKYNWKGLYFGGVAFKYQTPVLDKNLDSVSKVAKEFMDVVTTSGDGTGRAAKPDKIAVMKYAIGDHALGLASGVSVSNVHDYLPYVNAFLVATSIEDDFGILNEKKTNRLAKLIREYKS